MEKTFYCSKVSLPSLERSFEKYSQSSIHSKISLIRWYIVVVLIINTYFIKFGIVSTVVNTIVFIFGCSFWTTKLSLRYETYGMVVFNLFVSLYVLIISVVINNTIPEYSIFIILMFCSYLVFSQHLTKSMVNWTIPILYAMLEVFQIDQLNSVSVHLQLNLVKHVVAKSVSSVLRNTIYILFVCMQITTLAMHHLCLLVDLHKELQLCINDVFAIQNAQLMKAYACDTIFANQLSHK